MTRRIVLGMMAALLCTGAAHAGPVFDVIVPSHIRLSKTFIGGITFSGMPFGWLAGTVETITPADLAGVVVDVSIDDPAIGVATGFDLTYNSSTPIPPDEVAGWSHALTSSLFLSEMEPSETFRNVQRLWTFTISKPGGYFTTTTLHGSLTMGDQTATFSALVELVEAEATSLEYVAAQRISSTPEPATMSLLALGGMAVLRRRRK